MCLFSWYSQAWCYQGQRQLSEAQMIHRRSMGAPLAWQASILRWLAWPAVAGRSLELGCSSWARRPSWSSTCRRCSLLDLRVLRSWIDCNQSAPFPSQPYASRAGQLLLRRVSSCGLRRSHLDLDLWVCSLQTTLEPYRPALSLISRVWAWVLLQSSCLRKGPRPAGTLPQSGRHRKLTLPRHLASSQPSVGPSAALWRDLDPSFLQLVRRQVPTDSPWASLELASWLLLIRLL